MKEWPVPLYRLIKKKRLIMLTGGFLDRILGTMNFGPQFRSYIKSIFHDIRSAIISNGYVSEFFHVQRGVRQGCPL
jgi:hypothetical protein